MTDQRQYAAALLGCTPDELQPSPFVFRATNRPELYTGFPGSGAVEDGPITSKPGVLVVEGTYMEWAKTSPAAASNLVMFQLADDKDNSRQILANEGYAAYDDNRPGSGDAPTAARLHTATTRYVSVHVAQTTRLTITPAELATDADTYYHLLITGTLYQKIAK